MCGGRCCLKQLISPLSHDALSRLPAVHITYRKRRKLIAETSFVYYLYTWGYPCLFFLCQFRFIPAEPRDSESIVTCVMSNFKAFDRFQINSVSHYLQTQHLEAHGI